MNPLKYCACVIAALSTSIIAHGAAGSFSGTALNAVPNISVGDVSFLIIDEANLGFGSISFTEGALLPTFSVASNVFTLTNSAGDAFGSNFTVAGTRIAAAPLGPVTVSGTYTSVQFVNGVDSGDKFAIVVFSTSTSTALANDTYRIYTDPTWVVPNDGATLNYQANPSGANFRQLGAASTPAFVKTVTPAIPEPSAYAALAGVAVLGLASLRRRRA